MDTQMFSLVAAVCDGVYEPNSHVLIVSIEDHCSSARPACGLSKRRNDHGYETEGRTFTTQQRPEGAKEVGPPVCPEEGGWRSQAGAAQGDDRLPVRDEVPGCSREGPVLRRIAHSDTFDLRHIAAAVHAAGPLRIPLAVTGQPAEPDGLALEP
jgi:hypothetical protein